MKAVRYVGQKGCNDEAYQKALRNNHVVVSTTPNDANVTLRFEIDGKPLQIRLSKSCRDFLDFATCVYILDELVPREKMADGWTRPFELLFPVHEPARWDAAAESLESMLWTLSGDEYQFAFAQATAFQSLGSHRRNLPGGYDTVCLFSGGMDSLLGAYRLLAAHKRVLLVGHQADPTAASVQSELAAQLAAIFPPVDGLPRFRLIQCRVARSMSQDQGFALPRKCEETHRPRSLLFLSLAIAVAGQTRIKEIHLPENGLIALNPVLQKSRIGTLSTRTAHPLFLEKFSDLTRQLGIFEGAIRNPFLYMSKTDMLSRDSLDHKLKPLLLRSVSCARPNKYKDRAVRHCGYCIPCLYRRISMMDLGLDRARDYAFDVFSGLADMSPLTQLDFRALVSFAKRVEGSSALQREAMVLSHGAFSPALGGRFGPHAIDDYRIWSEMLSRWARDFMIKVRQLSSVATKQILTV
jgi:7-cyano-7-deazaguanine synthase in queuosine biosynthesis